MPEQKTSFNRRHFIAAGGTLAAASQLSACADASPDKNAPDIGRPIIGSKPDFVPRFGQTAEDANAISAKAVETFNAYPGLQLQGSEKIAMLCYPQMTLLDLVGPQFFFSTLIGAKVYLVSADDSLAPIMGDTGFAILPDTTFADCPRDLDILFVPGGTTGTIQAVNDKKTIDFVADRGARAKYITSVCTGAFILGQAGFLRGKKATSHWSFHHLLSEFGATPTDARVVTDGNVITGAGVSAGIDFALTIVAMLRGQPYAEVMQLAAQYAPEPPFNAGDPRSIDPVLGQASHESYSGRIFKMKESIRGI